MEKRISYLNRTYADYKEALIEMAERYYPNLSNSFRDASIAAWQIDMVADIADNLSYYIDRALQETNINSANEKSSLYAIARNNGVKIPGPKGAIAEVRISVDLDDEPSDTNAPIIKKGTKFSSGSQQFELLDDVDFASQFDVNGNSDRTITPQFNSNGILNGYTVSKLAVVTAGETRVYMKELKASDITPFMELVIPVEGVMNIESVIVVDGPNQSIPSYNVFYGHGCEEGHYDRFYEVDNLAQAKCWVDDYSADEMSQINEGITSGQSFYHITKGMWKTVKHKFITEYTERGYLKLIFGCGTDSNESGSIEEISNVNKWVMSRILNNENLGVLPRPNSTIYILYRLGGGSSSNVAKGAINKISSLNAEFRDKNTAGATMNSLRVENTTPSFSGKDMPSEQELKYYIKYHKSAQERCVTVKDYIDRILLLPSKYGTPFRVGVAEENNKIVVYLLGIDNDGKLTSAIPSMLAENIKKYLDEYRVIGDCIEIKRGKVVNIGFDIDAIIDKNYNKNDVLSSMFRIIEDYMDINKHLMGEEIYVGDIQKELGKIDGVLNIISLQVKNLVGNGYSDEIISQEIQEINDENFVDLEASDWILYNDGNSMLEIKNPTQDIRIRIKER